MTAPSYNPIAPVRLSGRPDPKLSRWLWLFKWLLLIPHYIVMLFLAIGLLFSLLVSWFAILFTARYPRGLFDFNLGVLRWGWRVTFYGQLLGTDRYPPFSLGEEPDYPARLDIEYPEKLSRGLVLVKAWLLAIPHYIVLYFLMIAAGVVSFITMFVVLFTGRQNTSMFNFVMGVQRWNHRVTGYAALMTDVYPPFSLDQGGDDPAGAPQHQSMPPQQPPFPPQSPQSPQSPPGAY